MSPDVVGRAEDAQVTEWALAAGLGDRAAFTAFVRATQRDVHRLITHLADRGEVEDLSQETYLRALTALPRFAAEASARTWLLSIARRVAADAVRRAQRRPRAAHAPAWEDLGGRPGRAHRAADGEVMLRMLVAELAPDRREAFVLTQVLDLGYAEAAQVCGCPVGTIRSRVARAREDLAAALETRRGRNRREA